MTDYNLISFDKIPSTQTHARRMIADGTARDKTVVCARAQSAGRGRGNHKWVSRPGNLYASFIYAAAGRAAAASYSFAVAAAEAIESFGAPVRIKWPNDLMADEKKICGILCEYCGDFLIVGIGVNIKNNPAVASCATAKIDDFARGATPSAVLGRLMTKFDEWRGADFDAVRARWIQLGPDIGSALRHRGRTAAYRGLSDDGAVLLRVGEKYELAYGGE